MKKVTLCADDYGQNQSISQAVIALLEKKRLSATSCMTTSPLWHAHAQWLHPLRDQADIGLHFNLTEGKPLSAQLTESHGFLPLSKLIFRAYGRLIKQSVIEAELHAQLDAFESAMGHLPDFIDGHQHIHQLPIIREALFKVYESRLRTSHCYLRCVYDPKIFLRINRKYFKELIIQLLGARTFKKRVIKQNIPHNSSFSGVYKFTDSARYARIFPRFVAEISDVGIIMCHPGLLAQDKTDVIANARYDEFLYLQGNDFVLDCLQGGIGLGRLLVK